MRMPKIAIEIRIDGPSTARAASRTTIAFSDMNRLDTHEAEDSKRRP
jgi:hypothetical protein